MRDTTVTELTEILRLLAQEGGKREVTSIEPNAEIIDHDPSDKLPAGYILVQDQTGHRMPAVKVAGMTYATGDKVNLIRIKGTEPIAFGSGSGSPSTGLPVHDHSSGTTGGSNLRAIQELEFDDAVQLTIDGAGAVTRTQVYHSIETNAGGPTDDLVTINGGAEGDLLIIRPYHDGHTVVVKHNTGNIWLLGAADISLDDIGDHLVFVYSSTLSKWCSIGDGGGGGGGAPVDAEYLVLALDATLTDERRFIDGVGLTGTDAGAGGNYTLDLDIPGLPNLGAVPDDADTFAVYDSDAAAHKEVTYANVKADPFFWWGW
jgi:hypothetical protein